MTKQEQVYDLIAKVSKRDKSTIKPEQDLTSDLGIDSPKGLQLLMDLEETLKIEISESDYARITTVNDILVFVETH